MNENSGSRISSRSERSTAHDDLARSSEFRNRPTASSSSRPRYARQRMIGTTVPALEPVPGSPAYSPAVLERGSRLRTLIDRVGPTARTWRAPGRVNLIGDHTDYQEGLCLPIAIDREVDVAYRPRIDGRVVVQSLDLGGTVELDAGGADDPARITPEWGRTVAGVGPRARVDEDGPRSASTPRSRRASRWARACRRAPRSRLRSSGALADAAEWPLAGLDLATAAQEAEHAAPECRAGSWTSSRRSRAGPITRCSSTAGRSPSSRSRSPPRSRIVVVHSGLPRALESSAYAERRAACEAAAMRLGLRSFRDATAAQVADDPLARHVVGENARVVGVREASARRRPRSARTTRPREPSLPRRRLRGVDPGARPARLARGRGRRVRRPAHRRRIRRLHRRARTRGRGGADDHDRRRPLPCRNRARGGRLRGACGRRRRAASPAELSAID